MQKYTFLTKAFLALTLAVAAQGCAKFHAEPIAPNDDLLVDANSEQVDVVDEQSDRRTLRSRNVRIRLEKLVERALTQKTVRLNVFDGDDIGIVVGTVNKISDSNVVIVGRLEEDEDSAVTLVVKDGILVANIRRGDRDERFEIRPLANGVHVVTQPADDDEGGCLQVKDPTANYEKTADMDVQSDDQASILAAPTMDVLVGYTPKAMSYKGGKSAIEALIQMGIADTNQALAESGANLQVRLAGIIALKQNESSSFSSDLTALRKKGDGKWDEVHAERARLGADTVAVVGAYTNVNTTAGIGYVKTNSDYAFSITKANAFSQYSFSHELGHNIGLNHEDGYENTSGKFRTIIAYGSYKRIRRYSNPSIKYNGYLTGNSSHNEAGIINKNNSRISALVTTK